MKLRDIDICRAVRVCSFDHTWISYTWATDLKEDDWHLPSAITDLLNEDRSSGTRVDDTLI
jgi:hypothetical protein